MESISGRAQPRPKADSGAESAAEDPTQVVDSQPTPPSSDAPWLDLSGERLGEFALDQRIGHGGFGDVYVARQPSLDRTAVIKVLRQERVSLDAVHRFMDEARLASTLDHPYAAHVYGFGRDEDAGVFWIAMEHIRGLTLRKLVEQRQLELPELVGLFERIAEVVHTAHERGMIHRDIKPANIMVVARAGRLLPKLLDFGIAKIMAALPSQQRSEARDERPTVHPGEDGRGAPSPQDSGSHSALGGSETEPAPTEGDGSRSSNTGAGASMGTPKYMSPEQWDDAAQVGPATDIYALGVVLYELLTGQAPYRGSSPQLRDQHTRGDIPPLGGSYGEALNAVVRKALAKDPEQRHSTALELAADFARAAGVERAETTVPQLPAEVREHWLSGAPEPVAESVALVVDAQTVVEQREALGVLIRAVWHHVGILALACASRSGDDSWIPQSGVVEHLRRLHDQGLDARGWLELARSIVQPHASEPEAFPIPELVKVVIGVEPSAESWKLLERLDDHSRALIAADDDAAKRRVDAVVEMLERLSFLLHYRIVVKQGRRPECWSGRHVRVRARAVVSAQIPEGVPVVVNADNVPVVSLDPYVRLAAPVSGSSNHLFYLETAVDGAAKLVSRPVGYELRSVEALESLRERFFDGKADESEVEADHQAPYRGLSTFRRGDAAMFFGRDRECDEVRNHLRQNPFVVVVGPSGSGKSSFVFAGVLGRSGHSERAITLRPGPNPMVVLAGALHEADTGQKKPYRRISNSTIDHFEGLLHEDAAEFGNQLREIASGSDTDLVIVVDQLEELFTQCHDAEQREAFARAIMSAVRSPSDGVRVIATVRDDFLARAESLEAFRDRLSRSMWLLTTPGATALRRILTEPARRVGYKFEDDEVVEDMIAACVDRSGALSLLSFAAAELWKRRDTHFKRLTRSAYETIGGVEGALSRYADDEIDGMTEADQQRARDLFRRLVTPERTRAAITRVDLLGGSGDPGATERVLERLLSMRLLVAREAEGGEAIELIHESLISNWERLGRWLDADAELSRLQFALSEAAKQWDARGRVRGLLWRGEALAEYARWRKRYDVKLGELEQEFIAASEKDERRSKTLRRNLVTTAVIGLTVALAVVTYLHGQAKQNARRAEDSAAEAREKGKAIEEQLVTSREERGRDHMVAGRPLKALVYLSGAYSRGGRSTGTLVSIGRILRGLDGLQYTLDGHEGRVEVATASADGKRIATGGTDNKVIVWDPGTGQRLATLRGHRAEVNTIEFDRAGTKLVSASYDGSVRLWEIETGKELRRFEHAGGALHAEFGDEGKRLLTAGADGLVKVWDVVTGDEVGSFQPGGPEIGVYYGALDSASGLVVSMGQGEAGESRLAAWSVDSGVQRWSVVPHEAGPGGFAYSPKRRLVATSDEAELTVKIWNARTGALVSTLEGHVGPIYAIEFDPAQDRILTLAQDRTARLWDAETGRLLDVLQGSYQSMQTAAFSADGKHILSGGPKVMVWDLDSLDLPVAEGWGHSDRITSVVGLPDGRIVSASWDGTAKVWSARETNVSAMFRFGQYLNGVAFSPTGLLASVGRDGTVGIRSVSGAVQRDVETNEVGAYDVSFDPSGARFVVGGADGVGSIWTVAGKQLATLEGHEDAILKAMFAPGDRVLTSSLDGTARVWSMDGKPLATLEGHTDPVAALAVDPAGSVFVTGGVDHRLLVWDADSYEQVQEVAAHDAPVAAAAFSPDGTRLASAGVNDLKLWNVADWSVVTTAIDEHVGFLDLEFSPDGSILASTGEDGALALWDAASLSSIDAIRLDSGGTAVAFSAAGDQVAVTTMTGIARVMNIAPTVEPPDVVAKTVRCLVPLVIVDERLVRRPTECD